MSTAWRRSGDTPEPTTATASPEVADRVVARRRTRRRRAVLRVLGTALILYGLSGIGLFVAVFQWVGGPLDEAGEMTVSIEGQRTAVVESLDEAVATIDAATDGIRNMDTSLVQARAATDRAALLSLNMASTMYQLRDQMGIAVFGVQPLIGLAPGFDQTGQQMELLSADVGAIGEALGANREDVDTVAQSMDQLQTSVERLSSAVRDGPRLEATSDTLASIRLGVFALVAWLVTLAVGCLIAGVGCWWAARRA